MEMIVYSLIEWLRGLLKRKVSYASLEMYDWIYCRRLGRLYPFRKNDISCGVNVRANTSSFFEHASCSRDMFFTDYLETGVMYQGDWWKYQPPI